MDPFVIIFFAVLLISWLIANELDKREKKKRQRQSETDQEVREESKRIRVMKVNK